MSHLAWLLVWLPLRAWRLPICTALLACGTANQNRCLPAALQTNVAGIYDRPPTEPGAQLIARLECIGSDSSGGSDSNSSSGGEAAASCSLPCGAVAYTQEGAAVDALLTSSAAHDTTGGVATKIREAAAVARLGAEVRIALAGSAAAEAAVAPSVLPAAWHGTVVRCRSGQ